MTDIATSYDVLLQATSDTRFGVENRWFIAASSRSRVQARDEFQQLCAEFPSNRVILLLVAVVHDDETGLFRDHIIDSRGLAPRIDRQKMQKLKPEHRDLIKKATVPPLRQAAPKPPPKPEGGGLGWWLAGGLALAMALLAVVRL